MLKTWFFVLIALMISVVWNLKIYPDFRNMIFRPLSKNIYSESKFSYYKRKVKVKRTHKNEGVHDLLQ